MILFLDKIVRENTFTYPAYATTAQSQDPFVFSIFSVVNLTTLSTALRNTTHNTLFLSFSGKVNNGFGAKSSFLAFGEKETRKTVLFG